jgi:hypothetical protein
MECWLTPDDRGFDERYSKAEENDDRTDRPAIELESVGTWGGVRSRNVGLGF